MTHESPSHDDRQSNGLRFPSCEGLADIDDLMRQFSDLVVLPPLCRERACREAERCKGGYGPPCLHMYPDVFVAHIRGGMRELRRFWKRQRAMAAERDARRRRGGPEP
jgi:hypothetical protein